MRTVLNTERSAQEREHEPVLEVQALRLGELVVVAMNAEPFVRIGREIRQLVPNQFECIVLGYANGLFGYLPDREAFDPPPGQRGYALSYGAYAYFHTPPLDREAVNQAIQLVSDALADLDV
jgi:hypothetical protein